MFLDPEQLTKVNAGIESPVNVLSSHTLVHQHIPVFAGSARGS